MTGLYSSEQGNIKPFPDATLKKEAIFALASDSHGTLWVGTQAGLRCYDANFIRTDPFPSLIDVKTLLTDRHGAVWIGSAGDGLIRSFNGKAGYLGTREWVGQ